MAHYAKINKENIVEQVIVADTQEWCEKTFGGEWVQTSYNTYAGEHKFGGTPLRKNFAGVGDYYDKERDAFIPPQLFPSWKLNEETCQWEAPIPYPTNGEHYRWSENNLTWELIPLE